MTKRKNSASLPLPNRKKNAPVFSLSQPVESYMNNSAAKGGQVPTSPCGLCNKKFDCDVDVYIFKCSVCESSYHGGCLNYDDSSLDLISAVFESISWTCESCQTLAKAARLNRGKAKLPSKCDCNAQLLQNTLDELIKRLGILEDLVSSTLSSTGQLHGCLDERSYSTVVGVRDKSALNSTSNSGQRSNVDTITAAVKAVHLDLACSRDRENKLVVSGLKPSAVSSDKDLVEELLSVHVGINVPVTACKRLVKQSAVPSNKVPLLLITFNSSTAADSVFNNARNLRKSASVDIRNNVYINRFLTKAEADAQYLLRKKRQEKNKSKSASQMTEDDIPAVPNPPNPVRAQSVNRNGSDVVRNTAPTLDSEGTNSKVVHLKPIAVTISMDDAPTDPGSSQCSSTQHPSTSAASVN